MYSMRRLLITLGLAIVLVVGAFGIAQAAIPSADGTIHGCYHNTTGALRIIDGDTSTCPSGYTALDWSQLKSRMVYDVRHAGGEFTCSAPGQPVTVFVPVGYVILSAYALDQNQTTISVRAQWTGITGTDPGLERQMQVVCPAGGDLIAWGAVIARVTPTV
jgi:hypothetical protein